MAQAQSEKDTLRALMKEFHSGMLVTRSADGLMAARPMAVAKLEDDDDLFFATSIASGKVSDIQGDHQAAVTFQSEAAYIAVSGVARVVTDRSKIQAYFRESMKVWFPEGADDPSLCLIQLRPSHAEFWDMQSTKGLRYVFEAAKSFVSGATPDAKEAKQGQHGEVGTPRAP